MLKTKHRKPFSRLLAVMMSLAMVLALIPATAMAEGDDNDGGSTTTSSGIELSKTATLEDDGTYTINLEAYATGEVKTTTETKTAGVPCDIVLVLDQSGSMDDPMSSTDEYIARGSQRYSYNSYDNKKYYYKDGDEYYLVSRGKTKNGGTTYYYLSYKTNNVIYYLNGNGVTTTMPSVTSKYTTIWTGVLYSKESTTTTRLNALKNAASTFIEQVQKNAADNAVDHKIAVVGFASGSSAEMGQYTAYANTELLSTATAVQYDKITTENYKDALVSANVDGAVNSRLKSAIDSVDGEGATFADYGLKMAKNILDNRTETTYIKPDETTADRKTIVVFFTDGYPGYTYDSNNDRFYYSNGNYNNILVANRTLTEANGLKASGATIYSIGIFSGANPSAGYNFSINGSGNSKYYSTGTQAANAFLHFVSSDFDSVTDMESPDRTTVINNGYYYAASSAEELDKVFETISSSIDTSTSTTTCVLDENSILRDVMANGFNADGATVSVKTADYQGNGNWSDETELKGAVVGNADGVVEVTGFSYKDNYVVEAEGDIQAGGKKLIVTISGVVPTDDAVTGEEVNTNAAVSGIYADAQATEPAGVFPQPKTILTKKTYVLDYAKPVTVKSADWMQDSITKLTGDMNGLNTDVTAVYGSVTNSTNTVTYSPKTTNWDGYDSFYAFGTTTDETIKAASANANGNLWSKISVIPANNVYYEDDFITDNSTGTVGIVYDPSNWTTVYSSDKTTGDGNTEDANGAVQGWINDLANDTEYSDGSAHMTNTQGATAEFTFTGTGVDIYSRTNMETGKVRAKISKVEDGTVVSNKTLVVDNLAESGDYYQVPTVSFSGEYGTYTVKLTVTTATSVTENARYTYYLDGIRVYNPIQNKEDDATVQEAYGSSNLNAVFTEVRDILIDAANVERSGEVNGAVFIDEVKNEEGVLTSAVGTYVDYGPKNEVYLAPNQAITFNVSAGATCYVGLKAPSGVAEVAFSKENEAASTPINHASDLYYKVVADSNGNVVIKNTGNNLLSVTKLRIADTVEVTGITAEAAVNAVNTFSLRNVVTYDASGIADEDISEEETPSESESEIIDESEEETSGDVVIENPEGSETPAEEVSNVKDWLNNLLAGLKKVLGKN
ncbi:MAG: hypothetical protein PUG60_06995 [Lachnospiraceae bacterium]|nr:hypothetical protein [Lachnospiraceae bacterium]